MIIPFIKTNGNYSAPQIKKTRKNT